MAAAEPEEKLSVERLFYDNLLLLGFEAGALAKKYNASLGADMFRRSNPKAMEVVVYFLLLRIAPEQTKENFHAVWPAVERDQQRDFKKIAFEALEKLEKEGRIPPNSVQMRASSMPTGLRFYLLMWNLSLHAMRVVLRREHANAAVPTISLEASSSKRAAHISRALKAQIVMETDLLIATATRGAAVQEQWRDFASRVQTEHKDLAYQQMEVKDMQARVDEELKKLPTLDEASQSLKLKEVRSTWTTLSQQAEAATAAAPTLEQVLARICNSIRLESATGERIEPAALAEHWRASLASLQRNTGGTLVIPAATKDLLEEQVRSHETQLAALRSLNATLSSSLAALQASTPSLLNPSSAPFDSLFVPPTPARLPKAQNNFVSVRPNASRRLQALPEQAIDEERLSQTIHAAAQRSVAPAAPVVASVTIPVQQIAVPQATAAPVNSTRPITATAAPATVARASTTTKPAAQKAPASVAAPKSTKQAKALPKEAEKENDTDESLTELAEEYAQQIRPSTNAKPSLTAAKSTKPISKSIAPAPVAAAPKGAKAATKTAATQTDTWSPAPPRSERLASMRARTQALLAASPPPPPPVQPIVAATTKPATQAPLQPVAAPATPPGKDEDVLSDLSFSVLSNELPSPVVGSGAPQIFELGSSPPLYQAESLRLEDGRPPAFTLNTEALTLSPLNL